MREEKKALQLPVGVVGAGGDLQHETRSGEAALDGVEKLTVSGLSSTTIAPIAMLCPPRSCCAVWLRLHPSSRMASSTRVTSLGDTFSG